MGRKRAGQSYQKRVADINRVYDRYAGTGLPNREIWLRYIYPVYGVSERTFYNLLKAPTKPGFFAEAKRQADYHPKSEPGLFDEFNDEKF